MAFPKVSVIFKGVAANAIKRGDRGVVALLLKDAAVGIHHINSVADMPTLSAENKRYVEDAFMGGQNAPKKVIVVCIATSATDYNEGLKKLETLTFDYLAVPGIGTTDVQAVAGWVKTQRDNKRRKIKVVLPKCAGDHEGIINFATDNIVVGSKTYTAAKYTARIAGILAGTPMNTSCTFFVLPEVNDVPAMTDEEKDAAVDEGKLIIVNDGRKCKIARGVNSLTTVSEDKPEQFKKIKLVDILDLIHEDIKFTVEDNYIGKIANSYDNTCLLISAINGYFGELEGQNMLAPSQNLCEYDVDAKMTYLKANNRYDESMSDIEVKEANSGDKVFLKASIRPLDVMEDIIVTISL